MTPENHTYRATMTHPTSLLPGAQPSRSRDDELQAAAATPAAEAVDAEDGRGQQMLRLPASGDHPLGDPWVQP